jgi:hypothetical protein
MLPLARIISDAEAAGYRGPYELEMLGPRIDAEGLGPAAERGLAYLDDLLTSIGVAPA